MNKKQRLRDGKLVLDYQSGKTSALPILVKRWHKTFCEKAFWLVKDADVAKDMAQDSWYYTKSLDWINRNKKSKKYLEAYILLRTRYY